MLREHVMKTDLCIVGGGLAGIVLHIAGEGNLSAVLPLFQNECAQAAPARIQSGGQTRRPGPQDDDVIYFVHVLVSPS